MSVSAQDKGIDLAPVRPLLARVLATCRPEQVWLFGSRARGQARPESDWDLLVVVPDDTDEGLFDPLVAWRMSKESGVPADVILCRVSELREGRTVPNSLGYEVDRDGVLLYER